MGWKDRVTTCEVTSPSGTTFALDFEDLEKGFDHRTSAFNFIDGNGTFIQQSGVTGRTFPMQLFVWGEDYDLVANAFDSALAEQGFYTLQHPLYGTFTVRPVGSVSRVDRVVTRGNQAEFSVTFAETLVDVFPNSALDAQSQALQTIQLFNEAQASYFENQTDLDTAIERVSLKNSYSNFLDSVTETLEPLVQNYETQATRLAEIKDSINLGIDVLVAQPATLAFQTLALVQEPGRILQGAGARLSAYASLIGDLLNVTYEPDTDSRNANAFFANDLNALGLLSGAALVALNNDFTTRTEALQAADTLLSTFESTNTWRENNFTSLGLIDTGETYDVMLELLGQTIGYLMALSFGLLQERTRVLEKNRNIVELCYELYGSIDDRLDLLLISNNLVGSEILELPRGREIVYYV